MDKVSIIVPVYNAEKTLAKCLESIQQQTWNNFECLLIVDGATDSSLSICNKFAAFDQRFFVYSQKNMGVSAARNKGIDVSIGDWITFIDSDDWVSPQFLSSYFDGKLGDVIFQGIYRCSNSCKKQFLLERNIEGSFIDKAYSIEKGDLMGWTFNKMFKASIIRNNKIHFPIGISLREDMIFTLTFLNAANSIEYRNVAYYNYVETEGSLMTRLRPYDELNTSNDTILNLRNSLVEKHPSAQYAEWFRSDFMKYKISYIRYAYYKKYRLERYLRYRILNDAKNVKLDKMDIGNTDKLIFIIVRSCMPVFIRDFFVNIIAQLHGRIYYK